LGSVEIFEKSNLAKNNATQEEKESHKRVNIIIVSSSSSKEFEIAFEGSSSSALFHCVFVCVF